MHAGKETSGLLGSGTPRALAPTKAPIENSVDVHLVLNREKAA